MSDGKKHVWHGQQEKILKEWSEISSSYRFMHDRAHGKFHTQNLWFALPVIVLSTVTGTANFAHEAFPDSWKDYVPLGIGFLNLTAGLITTIAQFLRVSEKMEGHRAASISYSKLARNIAVELSLPVSERTIDGSAFIMECRTQLDRLLEQSPDLDDSTINKFEKRFKKHDFHKPAIIDLRSVDVYKDDEAELAANVGGINSIIRQPVITNRAVDPLLSANGDVLYDFTGGNAIIDNYSNIAIDTNLEWRPSDDTNYQVSAGMTNGGGLFFQDLGIGYADGSTYWGQVQATMGNWYAQAFVDHNDGGGTDNPTFLYGTGLRQVAERTTVEAQIQYNFDMPWLFDSEWTVGYDYRDTDSNSDYTLWGRNEDTDEYITNGFYGQGTLTMSEKVDLVVAGRYDQASFISAGEFAPRAALVYKASDKTTWRLAYNKALSGPSALQMYIDFPVNVPAPGVLDAWLSGQSTPQRFADPANQVIDLAGLPIDIPVSAAGGGLPLAIPYGSVASLAWSGLFAQAPSLQPLLTPWIAQYGGPSGGSGILSPYDLFEPTQTTGNRNTRTGRFSSVENFELGVTSVIGDKLRISADIYSYKNTGFTNFSAIGDAYALVGSDIPGDLGAAVAADATAYVTGALTAVTTQTYQGLAAQLGLPFSVVASGALAAQGVPSLEASIAGGVAQTLGGINGAFQAGGQGFVGQLGPLFGAIGAVESDRVPQGDGITHITTGYITQGDAQRSHFGGDFSMDYFANSDLRLWANASWLSQNEWIPGEDNDDGLLSTSYLNAPMWKFRIGADYAPLTGFNFAISYQHDDKFRSVQGFWNGMVETKNLVDASVGYRFSPNLRFDISATNLTDNPYKTYPNLPTIRRRVLGKLTFNF